MFKRLDEKIAAAAVGSDARAALRRFARRLRSVSEEMRAHAATLEAFEKTPGEEWEALAVKRRRDLTAEFFEYLQTLAAAAGENMARREGALGELCGGLVVEEGVIQACLSLRFMQCLSGNCLPGNLVHSKLRMLSWGPPC